MTGRYNIEQLEECNSSLEYIDECINTVDIKRLSWTMGQNVLRSDETKGGFLKMCRGKIKTLCLLKNSTPEVKHGGGSNMLWGLGSNSK